MILLQKSPYALDDGNLIGRDPRDISTEDWKGYENLDIEGWPKAVRAKCIDCCGGNETEVRKCVSTNCPLWHLRMGTNPRGFKLAQEG